MDDPILRALREAGDELSDRRIPVTADEAIERSRMASPHRRSGRRRALFAAGLVCGSFAAGIGAAAAVSHFTVKELQIGLPGGSRMFEGTNPTCRHLSEDLFACELESPPPADQRAYADLPKVFVDDDRRVAGVCVLISTDLMSWLCVKGDQAVELGLITAEYLGSVQPVQGVG